VKNHLARDFSAKTPNTKWVTDITYFRTGAGWLSLAVIMDLCSRQVIGWSMQPQPGCDPSRADGSGTTDHSWNCGPALGSGNAVYGLRVLGLVESL